MKKQLLILTLCGIALTANSQNERVEKSIFGIQTGFLGIWAHQELRLSNSIALRTELGLDGGLWGGSLYDKTGFLLAPVITAEPRWYFNLKKRVRKSRRTDGNSGNFFSIKSSYHPDWFVLSNYDGVSIVSDLSIIPTLGLRRNIGNKINFETGFGFGYAYYFGKKAGYSENVSQSTVNLHIRIGYRF
jgi:hypothetical protein